MLDIDSKLSEEDVLRVQNVNRVLLQRHLRRDVYVNFSLTTKQNKVLEDEYPAFALRARGILRNVQHPVLNASRSIDEAEMWGMIRSKFGDDVRVTDIGGNYMHNVSMNRGSHCCNPILDQNDVVRLHGRGDVDELVVNNESVCSHTVQVCDCLEHSCFVASHSIYYLNPGDIAGVLINSGLNFLLASVHMIFEGYGVLGEDAWYVNDGKTVRFHAKMSGSHYSHPSINWMAGAGMHLGHHTLCWSFLRRNNISGILQFSVEKGQIPLGLGVADYSIPLPLAVDTATLTRVGLDSLVQLGLNYVGLNKGTYVYIPSSMLEDLRIWAMMRTRSDDLLKQMGGEIRRMAKWSTLPKGLLADSMPYIISFAYYKFLPHTTLALDQIILNMEVVTDYNDALKLKAPEVPFKYFAPILLAVMGSRGYWSLWNWLGPQWRKNVFCVVLGMWIYGVWAGFKLWRNRWFKAYIGAFQLPRLSPITVGEITNFRDRYATGEPFAVEPFMAKFLITRLPTFPPAYLPGELEALPIDSDAIFVINQRLPEVRTDDSVVPYGIINTMFAMPGAFNRSHETYVAMCKTRILLPRLTEGPSFDPILMNVWHCWHRRWDTQMFGEANSVARYDVNRWKDTYPLSMQKMITDSQIRSWHGEEQSDYHRGLFYKREFYAKCLQGEGWTGKRPRCIQSGKFEHHIRVLGQVLGVQYHLKEYLHPRRLRRWCVPCGASPEEMGEWFDHANGDNDKHHGKGDDGNFDVRNTEIPQRMNIETCMKLCPDLESYNALIAAGPTTGYYKDFIKVMMKWWQVHSGDIITYTGNTMSNFSRKTFMKAVYLRRGKCLFCEGNWDKLYHLECARIFTEAWNREKDFLEERKELAINQIKLKSAQDTMDHLDAYMTASGDDAGDISTLPPPPEEFQTMISLKLGYEYKIKINSGPTARFDTEFCSALWWPSSHGTILGPKLGRWVLRQCWFFRPPHLYGNRITGDVAGRCIRKSAPGYSHPLFAGILEQNFGIN